MKSRSAHFKLPIAWCPAAWRPVSTAEFAGACLMAQPYPAGAAQAPCWWRAARRAASRTASRRSRRPPRTAAPMRRTSWPACARACRLPASPPACTLQNSVLKLYIGMLSATLQLPLAFTNTWPPYIVSMQCICAGGNGVEHVLLHELRAVANPCFIKHKSCALFPCASQSSSTARVGRPRRAGRQCSCSR